MSSPEVVGVAAGVLMMHGGFGDRESKPLADSVSGLGARMDATLAALDRRKVDYLAIDAGSTDAGPFYLGSGQSMTHRAGIKQSFEAILPAAVSRGVPLIIGSCAMAGTRLGLLFFEEILTEVARDRGLHFTLATVDSEVDPDLILTYLDKERIRPLSHMSELSPDTVRRAEHIVAMQGTEPIIAALEQGADVVLCGRVSDSAMFAAVPQMRGIPLAHAWHMAKVIDHADTNIDPVPGVNTAVYGIATAGGFRVEATHPDGRIDAMRVAHATVYENDSPFQMFEPPGQLDISDAKFVQADPHTVEISGSAFNELPYTVKLEGAELVGYRSITIAGVRDPQLISSIDAFLEHCAEGVHTNAGIQGIPRDSYQFLFRVYGKNGVMGANEPESAANGHEIAVIGEAVAATQEDARALMNIAHFELLHYNYPGRKHTTGNMAFPFSPSDIDCGPVYRFSIWHLAELDDPMELCNLTLKNL